MSTSADIALRFVQRACEAFDAADWATFGALYHNGAVQEFVSQYISLGRHNTSGRSAPPICQGCKITRDLWCADDTGRAWWRYAAEWTDAESGEAAKTSGAATALVRDGAHRAHTGWIDLSFLLLRQ